MDEPSSDSFFVNVKRIPFEIIKDAVKWLMLVTKVILDILGVWPDRQDKSTLAINFFFISSYIVLIIAQIAYIMDKDTEVAAAADTMTGIISSGEAIGRRIFSVILAKKISQILSTIYYEFWPSDISGTILHNNLKTGSKIVTSAVIFETIPAVMWANVCAVLPLSFHKMPLRSKFWFPFKESPYYELLYIWESLMCMDIIAIVCAFDCFFITLIWHCVAQFRLLRGFLEAQLEEVIKSNKTALRAGSKSEAMYLFLICFRRHNNLIRTCKEIEGMLTVFILILYAGTVATVCISTLLVTVLKQEIPKAIAYFCGHMMQIFLYCYAGNELIIESTALSSAAFRCGWHLLSDDVDLQKGLVLMMVRSQREVHISVGGFGILSLASYMRLLQFCFSVYTLLSSVVSKNEN